ncbi:unnamed protein product [Adineta steineri]|uniref:DDB1-and CUL4-associated factor 6 n=1 Tax=Adineta steineri TaxID=433720 RepID=A0A815CNV2_9BILA|nr:unnamed protein product [Adineta steineri]CAF3495180.1 unnamed protein product [Adineta steineri]
MPYLSDRQYGLLPHRCLLVKLKNSSSITRRLNLDYKLNVHRGCVNTIWWNESGTTILSGSDDQNLIVTNPYTQKVLTKVHSGHRENIFSAKFLPETNDRRVVSCSGDGVIFHTNFDRPNSSHSQEGCFTCHGSATAYEVRTIPHTPNLFLSCSDDCTVRLYDLRTKNQCLKDQCKDDVLIKSNWGITSMDVNPMNPNEIVCACADSSVRLYDHRKLSTQVPLTISSSINGLISYFSLSDRKKQDQSRITSVVFNSHGTEILASYSSESIYLLDPKQVLSQEQMQERLTEHKNNKRIKTNLNENQPVLNNTQDKENKNSPVKRLRLRGDWSDTGPESRPSNEEEVVVEETATVPVQSDSSDEQQSSSTSGRNLQNFFMQRMSDILTQLVTSSTSETEQTNEETEIATTTNESLVSIENNDHLVNSSTRTSNNDETDPNHVFDLIYGENERLHTEDEDEDDDDDDDEELQATTNTTQSSRHARTFLSSKWDRLRKCREAERSQEENLLKNIPSLGLINSYEGHRNARTMIKEANFWSDSYVMSGSDCGHIFIWDKFNGEIIRIIPADEHVVNCVQPHPLNYPILASSGIDYDIKIFSPLAEIPVDDTERINRTVKRNHAMLEETSSTIRVPANFIFRMLTSIYRLRHPEDMSTLDDEDLTE